ncbi:CinA family protein [Streptomyces sp. ISL-11]|uniref:CinA family protein n=1 Tax=Streptomyces sp. ISL-11 TaxID=2819174 RepID=UPI001BE7BDA8|nr:nicotinamide-nucleotide amidohydrolase family protein [Streptomyces sp. ISL-11]MBT2387489.1 nicotinamide-nucleotide amidohydrolase family protein [Streptomyces sp. ISL-11]
MSAAKGAGSPAGTAAAVLAALVERGATVAAAESLTGGLVAAELTAAPGASRSVRGSVTAYATEVKCDVLGVDAGLLAERGAVDPDVAGQMARGVRKVLGADWGIATTGVAGPDEQDGKPVGTVFVAVAGPGGAAAVDELSLNGGRTKIRAESVQAVLELLLSELTENAGAKDTEHNGGN